MVLVFWCEGCIYQLFLYMVLSSYKSFFSLAESDKKNGPTSSKQTTDTSEQQTNTCDDQDASTGVPNPPALYVDLIFLHISLWCISFYLLSYVILFLLNSMQAQFWGSIIIGVTLSVRLSVYMSGKHNSS